uniref:Putative vrille n=1 Tax=Corethrella appendiculata TaxID=1370023 RepID=U5ERL9_9DIPT
MMVAEFVARQQSGSPINGETPNQNINNSNMPAHSALLLQSRPQSPQSEDPDSYGPGYDLASHIKRKELFSQRKQREFIPDNKKDDSYWDRRRRNNEAAKRSREKRRFNDMVLEQRVVELTKENHVLKAQLDAIKDKYNISGENLVSVDQILATLPTNEQVLSITKRAKLSNTVPPTIIYPLTPSPVSQPPLIPSPSPIPQSVSLNTQQQQQQQQINTSSPSPDIIREQLQQPPHHLNHSSIHQVERTPPSHCDTTLIIANSRNIQQQQPTITNSNNSNSHINNNSNSNNRDIEPIRSVNGVGPISPHLDDNDQEQETDVVYTNNSNSHHVIHRHYSSPYVLNYPVNHHHHPQNLHQPPPQQPQLHHHLLNQPQPQLNHHQSSVIAGNVLNLSRRATSPYESSSNSTGSGAASGDDEHEREQSLNDSNNSLPLKLRHKSHLGDKDAATALLALHNIKQEPNLHGSQDQSWDGGDNSSDERDSGISIGAAAEWSPPQTQSSSQQAPPSTQQQPQTPLNPTTHPLISNHLHHHHPQLTSIPTITITSKTDAENIHLKTQLARLESEVATIKNMMILNTTSATAAAQ